MTDTSVAAFLEKGLLASNPVPLSPWESVAMLGAFLAVSVVGAWGWSRLADAAADQEADGGAE